MAWDLGQRVQRASAALLVPSMLFATSVIAQQGPTNGARQPLIAAVTATVSAPAKKRGSKHRVAPVPLSAYVDSDLYESRSVLLSELLAAAPYGSDESCALPLAALQRLARKRPQTLRALHAPEMVTWHTTQGPWKASRDWLCKTADANFLIDDGGVIHTIVPLYFSSNGSGMRSYFDGRVNIDPITVNIEHQGLHCLTAKQQRASTHLINGLAALGITVLRPHSRVAIHPGELIEATQGALGRKNDGACAEWSAYQLADTAATLPWDDPGVQSGALRSDTYTLALQLLFAQRRSQLHTEAEAKASRAVFRMDGPYSPVFDFGWRSLNVDLVRDQLAAEDDSLARTVMHSIAQRRITQLPNAKNCRKTGCSYTWEAIAGSVAHAASTSYRFPDGTWHTGEEFAAGSTAAASRPPVGTIVYLGRSIESAQQLWRPLILEDYVSFARTAQGLATDANTYYLTPDGKLRNGKQHEYSKHPIGSTVLLAVNPPVLVNSLSAAKQRFGMAGLTEQVVYWLPDNSVVQGHVLNGELPVGTRAFTYKYTEEKKK